MLKFFFKNYRPNAVIVSKAMLEAQSGRLADAAENVFRLETERKENQPKIDRLRDYEAKINQLMRAQRLWCVTYPSSVQYTQTMLGTTMCEKLKSRRCI